MWWLSRETLRSRKVGFAGAFAALMCAAALITACGAMLETGLRGGISPQRYAGAPVVVSADQDVHQTTVTEKKGKTKVKTKSKPVSQRAWLDAELADTIGAVPGVEKLVADVSFPASLVADGSALGGESFGHAWDSAPMTPMEIRQGDAPSAEDELVLDEALAQRAGLKVGDTVEVTTGALTGKYQVAGIAGTNGRLDAQSAIFFTTDEAARLSGRPGELVAFGVFPEAGTDPAALAADLSAALKDTGAVVTTGEDRGPVEFLSAERARIQLVSIGGALGGTSLLVAILVVSGTFALTLQQRQRELALLRAVGATPRQVRSLIGGEALFVGVTAGVLGAVAGLGLAGWLRSMFIDLGAIPPVLDAVVSPFPMVAALGATVLAAWAAARISVRRAAQVRPAEALGESAAEPRTPPMRIVAGLIAAAGYVALLILLSNLNKDAAATPVTFLSVVLAAVAVSLLGPLLVRVAVAICHFPLRLLGTSGYLAGENGRAQTRRMAAVVTPLTLMIAMTCTILFVPGTLSAAAAGQLKDGSHGDFLVEASGPGVPDAAVAALSEVDGVAVTAFSNAIVRVGITNYPAQGVTPEGLAEVVDLDVTAGDTADLTDKTVAISNRAAEDLGLSVGDPLEFTLADNTPVKLTVIALYQRSLGFGDLTTTQEVMSAHVDGKAADRLLLTGDSGALPALREVIADYPTVQVTDLSAPEPTEGTATQANPEVNLVAMGLIIAFTLIAVINTLVMSTAERSREYALLRLVGTTRAQVRRMVRGELAAVALLSVGAATLVTVATTAAFSAGMTGSAVIDIPMWTWFGIVAAALAVAVGATTLSVRLALRTPPSSMIGTRL